MNKIKFIAHFSGNHQLLREKILSIPEHLSNTHTFDDNEEHKKCSHPPLTGQRSKKWLSKDSLVRFVKILLTPNGVLDPYRTEFMPTVSRGCQVSLLGNVEIIVGRRLLHYFPWKQCSIDPMKHIPWTPWNTVRNGQPWPW